MPNMIIYVNKKLPCPIIFRAVCQLLEMSNSVFANVDRNCYCILEVHASGVIPFHISTTFEVSDNNRV